MSLPCHLIYCSHLNGLREILCAYDKNDTLSLEKMDINILINDFLHILADHKTDDEFEYIYTALGGSCDVTKCNMLKRNVNRANVSCNDNSTHTLMRASHCQILDKIHTFYRHCYDLGCKLSSYQR
eukprot:277624_1